MVEERVYISFREKGTENPRQLLRVAEPVFYAPECSIEDSSDPCAVDSESIPFYLKKLV